MQDVSAQNMDLSGSLDVSQNTTIGGTLSVIGNETVGGTLGVTNTTTLTGNVGIGGASGSHNLLVTGSERITGNLDVSGDLNVNGNINLTGTLSVTEATTLSSLSVTGNVVAGTIDSGNITGRTGTTITAPTITASGNLYVGQNTNDSSTKSIFFGGGFGDNGYDLAVIENRIYSATEQSELLLFKGNDAIGAVGPDRIRLRAATIAFDTYPADTRTRTDENVRMTILSNGNVGIGTKTPTTLLDVSGTGRITGTTTLTGNVGIGGASGTETLLVSGSERITGNLDVSGDLNVTGNFNFNEIIQNITTVNNEVIISTQLDISNQGTGPALKVSQFGVGEDQDVAVFNAGDEGDAFKIDYAGNSHFYKPVNMNQTFDTILIRRPDAVGGIINLRTLQVFVNGVNILLSSTNSTQSIQSGSIGNVIEFITWNNSVVSGSLAIASNIRLNNIQSDFSVHSLVQDIPYMSLYIPLTQSFSISDVQSVVLYNRAASSRINGFQIELYNRSGFTPGVNVLYTMPINTTTNVYRFDLPSISSYTGFSSVDSQTLIKDITVSYSYFSNTLLKVDGNVEFGGGLSVSGATTLNSLNVTGQMSYDTDAFHYSTGNTVYTKTANTDITWTLTRVGSNIQNGTSFRPKYSGKYLIILTIHFSANSSGQCRISLKVNNVEYNLNNGDGTYIISANSVNQDVNALTGSIIVQAVAGKDIKAFVKFGTCRYYGSHSFFAGHYIGDT
jgi:cytoskeletal protein CcmA (bactofilin family)